MQYESLKKLYYKDSTEQEKIYQARFNSEAAYKFDFAINGYTGFVLVNMDIVNLVMDIMDLDKRIIQLVISDDFPVVAYKSYLRECITDEIKMTNEIEGVHSSRQEIKAAYDDIVSNTTSKRRLQSAVYKYNLIINQQTIPLNTSQDIRQLYDEFVYDEIARDDKQNLPDGRLFRKDAVDILSATQRVLHRGVYPESQIITMLDKALAMLHDENINHFIRTAVFHYLFGYIHPFYDGNGRMTRFISTYLLSQKLFCLSAIGLSMAIKQDLHKYYKAFETANHMFNKADLTGFVIDFLEYIKAGELAKIHDISEKCQLLYTYKRTVFTQPALAPLQKEMLWILGQNTYFAEEGLQVRQLANIFKCSEQKIRKLLSTLPAEFIQITRAGKYKLYRADIDNIYLAQSHK